MAYLAQHQSESAETEWSSAPLGSLAVQMQGHDCWGCRSMLVDSFFNQCGYSMLALKLTLVPSFLLLISLSGKWWGPAVAGQLAALPVIAGSILYLLVLEHGPAFGSHAAVLSLAAIFASEAFNFAYAWTCRIRAWPIALAAGMLAWFSAAWGLSLLPASPPWAIAAAGLAVALAQTFLPRSLVQAVGSPLTHADLIGRMIAGAALTLLVTALSTTVGAKWSGLLAVFPLLAGVLSVASQRAHGHEFVLALLRGMVVGRFSFAAFCLWLWFALPLQPSLLAFAEAAALALIMQGVSKRVVSGRLRYGQATSG